MAGAERSSKSRTPPRAGGGALVQARLFVTCAAIAALQLGACASKAVRPAAPAPAAVAVQPVCADFSFPIYFQTNSARLTEAAAQVVRDAAARVRGCKIGRIDVVGLADADGAASRNLVVSRERAAAVADALARAGLPRPSFDIDAVGAMGALTPDGRPEPLRRRTEVIIRAAPPPGPATPSGASAAPAR